MLWIWCYHTNVDYFSLTACLKVFYSSYMDGFLHRILCSMLSVACSTTAHTCALTRFLLTYAFMSCLLPCLVTGCQSYCVMIILICFHLPQVCLNPMFSHCTTFCISMPGIWSLLLIYDILVFDFALFSGFVLWILPWLLFAVYLSCVFFDHVFDNLLHMHHASSPPAFSNTIAIYQWWHSSVIKEQHIICLLFSVQCLQFYIEQCFRMSTKQVSSCYHCCYNSCSFTSLFSFSWSEKS